MVQQSAQAQVIRAYGDETRFEATILPMPDEPPEGTVRVAVAAAAVNPVDLSTRAGKNIPLVEARFPMVLGWDMAGTVVAVGVGVDRFRVGDRVAAMTFQPLDQNGTYRAVMDLSADLAAPVPEEVDLLAAATLPLVGLTAAQIVEQLDLDAGKTLYVNASLGAVGRVVVQLAAAGGVHVIGAAADGRSSELESLGARTVLPRGATTDEVRAAAPGGLDAAVDLIGGSSARTAFAAVRDGGRYVTSVPPYIDASGVFDTSRGIDLHLQVVHPDTARLADLLTALGEGTLTSPIEQTFPLDRAAEAHLRQAGGGLRGKLLLVP